MFVFKVNNKKINSECVYHILPHFQVSLRNRRLLRLSGLNTKLITATQWQSSVSAFANFRLILFIQAYLKLHNVHNYVLEFSDETQDVFDIYS